MLRKCPKSIEGKAAHQCAALPTNVHHSSVKKGFACEQKAFTGLLSAQPFQTKPNKQTNGAMHV